MHVAEHISTSSIVVDLWYNTNGLMVQRCLIPEMTVQYIANV